MLLSTETGDTSTPQPAGKERGGTWRKAGDPARLESEQAPLVPSKPQFL